MGHHLGHGRLARGRPPLPLLLRRVPLLDQGEVVLEHQGDLRARRLGGAQGGRREKSQHKGDGDLEFFQNHSRFSFSVSVRTPRGGGAAERALQEACTMAKPGGTGKKDGALVWVPGPT